MKRSTENQRRPFRDGAKCLRRDRSVPHQPHHAITPNPIPQLRDTTAGTASFPAEQSELRRLRWRFAPSLRRVDALRAAPGQHFLVKRLPAWSVVHVAEVRELVDYGVDQRRVAKRSAGARVNQADANAPVGEAESVAIVGVGPVGVEFVGR